ncbi:Response regulator receiver domain-containing protein [Hymenobacter daecheongensis DSM 21074]|uniref:Response regulator receiver domain-containing protein n=1 Tax=Hymenobacter daecheongensis DSM 21074 TaxID=1121955 RepID=A0A1M6MQZ4_9BACT|nr:response regulator [Hymenobacter daecheongensis]SHJ85816.1 Response regulator receiver domain-containing protein [Hymenobacter daecheongensis DSM 21074]
MEPLPAVLLVDDDDTANFLHHRLLLRHQAAHRVEAVHSGAEALAWLTATTDQFSPTHPALILLDINMPDMNGYGVLAAFQQLPPARQANARFVIVTSSTNAQDLRRLAPLPLLGVVQKPLTAEKLSDVLAWYWQPLTRQPPFATAADGPVGGTQTSTLQS